MVTTDLNVTYSIIWSLAIANVLGAGLCIALAQPISRLTTIPFPLLAPFMIAVICFASFQATRDLADLIALLALGVMGLLMKRFGWPRPALLIGFVLAPQSETYLYQAVQFYGWEFLARPGVLIIGALTAVSIWFGVRNRVDDTGAPAPAEAPASGTVRLGRAPLKERGPQIAFAALIIAIFAFALWDASAHSFLGAVFPMGTAAVAGFFGLMLLGVLVLGENANPAIFDHEVHGEHVNEEGVGSPWNGALWIAALVALTALAGFWLAVLAFFVIFLKLRAKAGWGRTLLLTAIAMTFFTVLASALSLNFPSGLLQSYVDLPWPLR